MKPRSLTAKLAALFACVSFAVMGTSGYVLYRVLEKQLVLRDDAALVTRVDQIRTLLQDSDLLDLIHDKPQLFANMLGNREALLVLRFPGQAPGRVRRLKRWTSCSTSPASGRSSPAARAGSG